MKRGWLVWILAAVFSVAMIFLLHAVRVLPLAPAPPYKNGRPGRAGTVHCSLNPTRLERRPSAKKRADTLVPDSSRW